MAYVWFEVALLGGRSDIFRQAVPNDMVNVLVVTQAWGALMRECCIAKDSHILFLSPIRGVEKCCFSNVVNGDSLQQK